MLAFLKGRRARVSVRLLETPRGTRARGGGLSGAGASRCSTVGEKRDALAIAAIAFTWLRQSPPTTHHASIMLSERPSGALVGRVRRARVEVRSSWTEQVRAAADLRQAPNSLTLVLRSSRVCTPLPLLFSFASVVLCGKTTQGNKATGDCLTRVLGGEILFSF